MFDVDYYELANGDKPAKQFIDGLDTKMRVKALGSIDILAEFGHIFYFFVVDNKIILTNGFVKKTHTTPPGEIALAKKYKANYEGRISKNE